LREVIEPTFITAAFTENGAVSGVFFTVLVPARVTMYVSIIAFLGLFQLVTTTPVEAAAISAEKTSVEFVWVLMLTATVSDALYPAARTFTVWVL
jgi:hypothetical protein